MFKKTDVYIYSYLPYKHVNICCSVLFQNFGCPHKESPEKDSSVKHSRALNN